ncbi:tetratricopeptide repeat protein [Malaciobacter mytili]|uniref:tetratricopeptide repeat protein n=1 Tax=Malaciobacter mytili TaxID=603050 RepID=UPI003A895E95
MRKYIFFVFIIFFNIYAKELKNNEYITTSNEFIFASSQYKLGNYISAYEKFNKLFLKYSDNVDINFYLGMSALKLKLYDDASAAFERVLIKKPDFHRARLEYARVLLILGFKEEAKKEFLEVLKYPIPQNVRKNIQEYIKLAQNNKELNSTFITLGFGFLYDSNINSGVIQDTFNLPGFNNLEVSMDKAKSSLSYTSLFQINHLHSISKDLPFTLKHSGTFFYKNQVEDDKYNFTYFSYRPTLFYNDNKTNSEYSLEFGFDKILTGDKADFDTYLITPKYKKLINKDTIFSIYSSFQEFHYKHKIDREKNYSKKLIGANIKYKDFTYEYIIDKDHKDLGQRSDIDKNSYTHLFYYSYDIQSTLVLNLKFQHKQIEYKEKDLFFNNVRKDYNNQFYIGLTKIIDKKDFLTLSYTKTKNNSNQEAYEYKRDAVYLNYIWRFRL